MKKTIFILLAVICAACVQEIDLSVPDHISDEAEQIASEPSPNFRQVNDFEVERVLTNIFRSQKDKSRNFKDIKRIMGQDENIILYLVNYSGNQGFALISGTKAAEPVMAYSYEGNFIIDHNTPDPIKIWYETTLDELNKMNNVGVKNPEWLKFEKSICPPLRKSRSIPHDEYIEMRKIMEDSMRAWQARGWESYIYDSYSRFEDYEQPEYWEMSLQAGVYPVYEEDYGYISLVLHKSGSWQSVGGNPIETKWSQGYPFNISFPVLENGRNAYVGCGNLAAGMIMKYFRHPENVNWDAMPDDAGNFAVSDFLFQLSQHTGSTYGLTQTTTDTYKIADALVKYYGYTAKCDKFSKSRLTMPCIMSGEYIKDGASSTSKHGWVISQHIGSTGWMNTEIWTFTRPRIFSCVYCDHGPTYKVDYYYVNWGWDGLYNGFYRDIEHCCPPGSQFVKATSIVYNIKMK